MAFITANNGPDAGKQYDLETSKNVLGRHPDCQITIDVGAVSRQHAQIVSEGNLHYIEDLRSRNGTFLNDKMIDGRQLLRNGDRVRVCDVEFAFHQEPPPIAGSPPASSLPERKPGTGTVTGTGMGTVVIDDLVDDSGSTIMSKLDVSSDSSSGGTVVTASAEAKLAALIEINKSLGSALALDEVLPQVLNCLFKIFVQADRGFIVIRADDGKLIPLWTKMRHNDSKDTIRISRTIVKQVMDAKEAILSADAATDSRFDMSQSIADFRIRSMMCAPLLDGNGNSIGVLQIDTLDQRKRFQSEDLAVLAGVAIQSGIAINNAQMHENALRQRALQRDLEVAHEVQRGFLPAHPPELPGYDFYDYYRPANHVGGDCYDYIHLPDGRLAVMVADVVGHGIAAALLMAKFSAEARYNLAVEPDPAQAVIRLNDALTRMNVDRFVTMILAVLDPQTHQVTIVSAGHMAPIWRRTAGHVEEPGQDAAGLPLGIQEDLKYDQHQITLQPGELLVLYTDGIHESVTAAGKMYGIDRIRQLATADGSPFTVGSSIVDDVQLYLREGAGTQEDDVCLVCFGRDK